MRNFLRALVLVLVLVLAGPCLPAHAEKIAAPTCPSRPIVVGLYEFGNFYRAGTGLDKDVAEQLRKRSGCRFTYKVLQRRAIWPAMQSGGVDMTLSAAATPERTVFAWAEPYMWLKNMVILRADSGVSVHSMADFIADPGMRLGFGRGYAAGPAYEDFVTQLRNIGRVEDVDDGDRLYALFKGGRFQALLAPKLAYGGYLKDEIIAGAVRVEDWAGSRPRGPANLLMAKKLFSVEDARRWAGLMKEMRADGTLQRLIAQYVGQDEASMMLSAAP
ncbi:polar amino acid transport system substrate-binding protein [Duganella sp. CF458]|uniref:substrate-binding periplasmic protein n=1 Tax=Duganella sp. CF458 TaxID=1884368 RepID=UPI0008F16464|nr:transporter substrate-binding domain-containing protein [Duganella sp. CF458]SFF92437.1 polar amino acid transport system substrate-binding protein [Duganella sp. CF458]